jgi:hypothetical protein
LFEQVEIEILFELQESNIIAAMATMKAVNYKGPFEVAVEDVPKPTIQHPDDVLVFPPPPFGN